MAAEKKTEEGQLPDLEAPKSQVVSRDEVSNFCGREKYGCVMFCAKLWVGFAFMHMSMIT